MTTTVISPTNWLQVLESKAGGEHNCFPGNGTLNTSVTSSLYGYRPVGTRYYASTNPWRAWLSGNSIDLSGIPTNALILDVDIDYYVRVDDTSQNFYIEMYDLQWGSLWSTSDWQSSSQLAALKAASKMMANDNTSGVSVGWNVMNPSGTNAIDAIQAGIGNASWDFMLASNQHSTDVTMNTSERSVLDLDIYTYPIEFTITYVVPDNLPIFLGTHF